MRTDKIKAMTVAALKKEYLEKKTKLNSYQLDLKSGKEKDTAKVKSMRRNIARILTVIQLKSMASEVAEAVASQAEGATTEKADTATKTENK